MTVDEYTQKLNALPKEFETTAEQYALIEEALRDHPSSARLWSIRGALIQLGPDDGRYTLQDAMVSYQTAIEVEPASAEGWQELGHYYDVHLSDDAEARRLWGIADELRKKNAQQGVPPNA